MVKNFIRRTFAPFAGRLTRNVVPILTYHRFGEVFRGLPSDAFEAQLLYLKRNYHVTSLRDVVSRLACGVSFEPNSVVLTVDDGHRDFRDSAYPLLRKHRIPATLFVVADVMLNNSWLWFDRLHYLFRSVRPGVFRIEVGTETRTFDLRSTASRDVAWESLADYCLDLTDEPRDRLMSGVERAFAVTSPRETPADYAYLTRNEIAGLDPELIEIGSHTLSHPILSRCDPARQKLEIEESLRLLRTQLGRDITSFAYPNGRLCDIDSNSIDLVRAAGYASAVTCEGVFVRAGADPHLLSRIGAAHSVAGLSRQLDGVSYFSSRLQRRLAIGRGAH